MTLPSQAEQLELIEAALRRRFFALVPRIDNPSRANWTDEQHDTDRLTRSLAAFTMGALANLDDSRAVAAVTDGSNDGGLDAFCFARADGVLHIVQSKFKRSGSSPDQADIQKTIQGVRRLRARQFDSFNLQIRTRLDEIEEALDTPGVEVRLTFAYCGETFNLQGTSDLDSFRDEWIATGDLLVWQPVGRSMIYTWLMDDETPRTVDFSINLENWGVSSGPKRAFYGQVRLSALADLVERHGVGLFEKNVRGYLGSVGVNESIRETAETAPSDFFYLNNGITAVASGVTKSAGGNAGSCKFALKGASVVNGAQTAGVVATIVDKSCLDSARVLMTIIEVGPDGTDFAERVTQARNYQTAIRAVDFAALDARQELLRQALAVAGVTYHTKRSVDAETLRNDAFTVQEAAVALALSRFPFLSSDELNTDPSACHATEFAVVAKKSPSLLADRTSDLYQRVFGEVPSAAFVCRCVRAHRFVTDILSASESSEDVYARRMFFRHGRSYMFALVARSCADVLRRPSFDLSSDDRTELSRHTNELAETAYAASQPLTVTRGYLSLFRNLTEVMALTNSIRAQRNLN